MSVQYMGAAVHCGVLSIIGGIMSAPGDTIIILTWRKLLIKPLNL